MLFGGHEGFTILELVDDDGTVFVNDFLPVQPPPLNQFERAEFLLLAADGKGSPITGIDGVVTSLVPEPATISLLGLGVAYLLARRKRE